MKKHLSQFLSYIFYAGICYGQDLGLYLFLCYYNVFPVTANIITKIIAAITGFVLQRRLVFKIKGVLKKQLFKYLILVGLNFIVNNSIFALLYHLYPNQYLKVLVDVVLMLFNFIISKWIIYV